MINNQRLKRETGEKGKQESNAGAKPLHEEGISRSERIRRRQRQPLPMIFPKTDAQVGLTKVFMKKPVHDILEAHKVFHKIASATILQVWIGCVLVSILSRRVLAAKRIQTIIRMQNDQNYFRGLKRKSIDIGHHQ